MKNELVGENYLKDSAFEKEMFIISIKDKWVFHMSEWDSQAIRRLLKSTVSWKHMALDQM